MVLDLWSRGRGFESHRRLLRTNANSACHAIPSGSVNEYQRKLGSKRAYHAMQWPRIRGHAASAGVRLRANETEISDAPWALRLGKGLLFYIPLTNYGLLFNSAQSGPLQRWYFYRSEWPNQRCWTTEGGWLVIQIVLNLTRPISSC